MVNKSYEAVVRELLSEAGVEINGNHPWDVRVHNPKFFRRVIVYGTLGLGESYMDSWWDCEAIDQLFDRLVRAELQAKVRTSLRFKSALLASRLFKRRNGACSMEVIDSHYNAESEILLSFLDDYKQYSCGYFKETSDLNTAQRQKMDLICRKLQLCPSDRLLDIGCGYGGLARYAGERYSCRITGVTPSSAQVLYARDFCKNLDAEFLQAGYMGCRGTYTKIVSVGMFEHVGYKNYRTFMKTVHDCLAADGLFLLHTIGSNRSVRSNDPWVDKYIFPNGMLPSIRQIAQAAEGLFVMEDLHSFGPYYDHTLMAWHQAFLANWPQFKNRFDDRTLRKWSYYFLHLAGVFRARKNQLWQAVFSKKGIYGGYRPVR